MGSNNDDNDVGVDNFCGNENCKVLFHIFLFNFYLRCV